MHLHPTPDRAEKALKNVGDGFQDFEGPLGRLIRTTIQDGFVTSTAGDLAQVVRDLRGMSGEPLAVAAALGHTGTPS